MGPGLSNSRPGHTCPSSVCLGTIAVLVALMTSGSLGCFPVEDVFKESCLWIQTISLQSRLRVDVCPENRGMEPGAPMRLEAEGIGSDDEPRKTLKCLRGYGEYRYKVSVTEVPRSWRRSSKETFVGYQCFRFTPLSDRVVRQEKSSIFKIENQMDCDKATYQIDEAVLIAGFVDSDPRPCPITGGYQLLMNLGESPSSTTCLTSVSTYIPQLLFECDGTDSSRAIIDLGKSCTPDVLWDASVLRGRYIAHLKCLTSWQENRGTSGEFTSVLFQLRDSYRSYWCLHFRRLDSKSSPTSEDVLYKMILTLDGRCLPDISRSLASPKDTDLFGKMVSFKPGNDTECKDQSYLNECNVGGGAYSCRKSLQCPANCERCKKNLQLKHCEFAEAVKGSWKSLSYDDIPSLVIGRNKVQSPQFGQFLCRSDAETGHVRDMYPMVQTGIEPTCWPYYSCAQIRSLAPGLLSFQMRPLLREKYNGDLRSCQETYDQLWLIRPEKAEEAVTLIDSDRLKPVPCEFVKPKEFPLRAPVEGCQLLVPECSGACDSFNISLNAILCDNMTVETAELYAQHLCVARINFDDGKIAVMTKILDSQEAGEVYRCWLFRNSGLMIFPANYCNQDQIKNAFDFDNPELRYDPFYQLIMAKSDSSDGNGGKMVEPYPVGIALVAFFWMLVLKTEAHYT